jgi:multidrug efflux system outer membrane protein
MCFKGGDLSQMELAQSESQYEEWLATIPQLEIQIAKQEDALSVLLGHDPGDILRGRALSNLVIPPVSAGTLRHWSCSSLGMRFRSSVWDVQGTLVETTLLGAVRALYDDGVWPIAGLVFVTTFDAPYAEWQRWLTCCCRFE